MRRNLLSIVKANDTAYWSRFVKALNAMKASGVYDGFTKRHQTAMMTATLMPGETSSATGRNVAHQGPAFFPWHRQFLLDFEAELRKVDTALPKLELPFLPTNLMGSSWRTSPVWGATWLGGDGTSASSPRISTGPFRNWTSVIYNFSTRTFVSRAGIIRNFDVNRAMSAAANNSIAKYDVSPWDDRAPSSTSFRRASESVHNTVHDVIRGDMSAGTSPNDPVFFLHHCNVDRLWSKWQAVHGYTSAAYQPLSGGPTGHNLNDTMRFLLRTDATAAKVLDHRPLYTYETA